MASGAGGGSGPDGRAARWAGQHRRRRGEFVDAAMAAIARYGPEVSTEQIAAEAGVARTRLYKHFSDAADLNRALAERVTEMITAELRPVLFTGGTPRASVEAAVSTHLRWLTRHSNLYRYLMRQSADAPLGAPAVRDIKGAIAQMLTGLFGEYAAALGLPLLRVDVLASGIVGLVEAATSRWLAEQGGLGEDELVRWLSGWIWLVLDDVLRAEGFELDPDAWLAPPPGTEEPPGAEVSSGVEVTPAAPADTSSDSGA